MNFSFDPETHVFTQNDQRIWSVTQILAESGLCSFACVDEEKRLHALERGTSVHWMTQLEDEGSLDYRRVPKAMRGYRKAYRTWLENSRFFPLRIEWQFVSPLGFAGIVDRVGKFPGICPRSILDLKTGSVADWTRFQLAAYSVGVQPNISIARLMRRIALRLNPDGTYSVKEFPIEEFDTDIAVFMQALRRINGN